MIALKTAGFAFGWSAFAVSAGTFLAVIVMMTS